MKLKDEGKKRAIDEKTLDIVFDKGIAGIKMAVLAKDVGISPSTLYVYYKNKEDLIVSLFTTIIKEQMTISKNENQLDLPFKLRLKKMWLQWLHFGVNNYKEMGFIEQVKQSPYYVKIPSKVKEEKTELGVELLEEGKLKGVIKNIENELHVAVISAILSQTVKLILSKELSLNEKNSDKMFSFVWDAIKT